MGEAGVKATKVCFYVILVSEQKGSMARGVTH